MKICEQCQQGFPEHAKYCIHCGCALTKTPEDPANSDTASSKGWNVFWLSLVGRLILPLLWFSRK